VAHHRAVVSEDELLISMEAMREAILKAGENHGQPIVFHVFTQVPSYRVEKVASRCGGVFGWAR
jgi:hypothetical protein